MQQYAIMNLMAALGLNGCGGKLGDDVPHICIAAGLGVGTSI